MKSWQLIAVLLVFIVGVAANILYLRSRTGAALVQLRADSTDGAARVSQRLDALEEALSATTITAISNAVQACDSRINELEGSLSGQVMTASSQTAADVIRRLETIERSIGSRLVHCNIDF